MIDVDWSKQCNGVHQAPIAELRKLMPDLNDLLDTFPDDWGEFTFDVKVCMLMPNQYPCIPGWHTDNVPRVDGLQRFEMVRLDLPMYLWISGPPLTQFKHGFVQPKKWIRFTQADEHRGTISSEFCWRGFIRASHKEILPCKTAGWQRKHTQIYLNAETFQW